MFSACPFHDYIFSGCPFHESIQLHLHYYIIEMYLDYLLKKLLSVGSFVSLQE